MKWHQRKQNIGMKTNGRKGKENENYRHSVQTSSVPWIRPLVTSIS